jgi:hypothetical protein
MSPILDTQLRHFFHYIQPSPWARPVWRLSFSPSSRRRRHGACSPTGYSRGGGDRDLLVENQSDRQSAAGCMKRD